MNNKAQTGQIFFNDTATTEIYTSLFVGSVSVYKRQHHVSVFLKCGAKIGIIFNIAKNETKIFEISALFFLLVDTYIVLLEQLSRAFDKDFQVFTSFRR